VIQNMSLWICKIKDVPNAVVRVKWHRDGKCGFSFVEPEEWSGRGGEIEETELIPVKRPPSIQPSGPLLTDVSSDALRVKLDALRNSTLRVVKPRKSSVKRKRKGATKGGLLGIIRTLSKGKQAEFQILLESNAGKDKIVDFLKEAMNEQKTQNNS